MIKIVRICSSCSNLWWLGSYNYSNAKFAYQGTVHKWRYQFFPPPFCNLLNTQYMTNPTIVYWVKMEYGWNCSISGVSVEKWSRKNTFEIPACASHFLLTLLDAGHYQLPLDAPINSKFLDFSQLHPYFHLVKSFFTSFFL